VSKPRLTFFCKLDSLMLQALFSQPDLVALGKLESRVSLGLLDFSPERAEVVLRLNEAGIPVIAWLLLPKEQEAWPNPSNCTGAAQCYEAFKDWTRRYGLQWAAVGLEIEPDFALVREFMRLRASRTRLLLKLLSRVYDFVRFNRARKKYRMLLERIRADGYQVESYQFPFVVDERKVWSTLLQRALGIFDLPVDKEVLMLYSSYVRPYGAGLIWSYTPRAQSIAVGSTGGSVDFGIEDNWLDGTPLSWEEFARDLRLGWVYTDDLYVFSLEGCVRQGFLKRLEDFEWDQPILEPVEVAARVEAWRKALSSALWVFAHPLLIVTAVGGLAGALWWMRRYGGRRNRQA
jgi:hypothetical protein